MPTLPTLTVTQTQADRMLAAFGSAAEYKKWLANQIIEYVKKKEWQSRLVEIQAERVTRDESVSTELMPSELAPPPAP